MRKSLSFLFALILFLLVILACALPLPATLPNSLPTETPQVLSTPTAIAEKDLPPNIVESFPLNNSQIALQEEILFYFNQAMERASVESALHVEPAVDGQFSWEDDATLKFSPNQPIHAGSKLVFTFGTEAYSAKGIALEEALSFSFNAAEALHPIQFLPRENSADVSIDSAVVVSFDQPVVPLGADSASLPAAGFNLEPPVSGHGEWLNTSTYIYYPESALAGGQTYHAILNVNLQSVAGTFLDEASEKNWGFTTGLPRLLEINPSTEIALPLDLAWTFSFNQPMDVASVEANFLLKDADGVAVAGSFEWADDLRSFTFIVDENLTRDSNYELFLGEGALALGGTPLGGDRKIEVYSSPNFAVEQTNPTRGGVTNEYQSANIFFTTEINDGNIEDYLTLSPPVADYNVYAYENGIHLNGNLAHETSYTLTVSSALKDIWGQELGEDFIYRFRTPAALSKLSFPYLGAPYYFSSARNPAFYIQSTNISAVDITLGKVSLADFFRLFGENGYDERQNYMPENTVSWQQELGIKRNKNETFALNLATESNSIESGIYSVRVNSAFGNLGKPNYIIASDVNLVFKYSATDVLIWATELGTGARLVGQPISIYDETGTLISSGITDKNGVWESDIPDRMDAYKEIYAMLGLPGDEDFGFSSSLWGENITPWSFNLNADYRPPHTEVYLYTDRPIYRPGQTVYFRAVLREAYDGRYSGSAYGSLPLTVSNDWGDNIASLNPELSEYGTAHGSYTIPENASAGYYSFYNSDLEFSTYFQVAEYRKPEINLALEMTPEELKNGESVSAKISAQYYFDAPASDLPIRWALYADKANFYLPNYRVGDISQGIFYYDIMGGYYGELLLEGEDLTNAEGILSLDFENLDIPDGTQKLTLEITITDDSGQWISESVSATVHPEEFYIGLQPDLWFGRENTAMGFNLLTVDWDTETRAVQNLRATFQRVTWEKRDSASPYVTPKYIPTSTTPSEVDLETGIEGAARLVFTPPDPGMYILEVSSKKASTSIMVWVAGAERALFPSLPQQHIELIADKENYLPGDTAEIFIPNPLSGTTQALITIERGSIKKSEVINLPENGIIYQLPLDDEDAPTTYLSAMLLNNTEYRAGYIKLDISPLSQILNVTLTSQPSRSEPGGEVNFGIQVSDSDGNPVQGEFSLAIVDLAVLALADPNSEPIADAFYNETELGVRTNLSIAGDSIYGVYNDGGGMGGGGGEAMPVMRENFPDTAYWNAEIVTNAKGQAQVSVVLPDNLTTWHIDLRGLTTDTRVGSAELEIISTKDVLIRPITPRFLVVGDHVEMAAIIHNNTTEDLSGRVVLNAIGFLLDNPDMIDQQINLPAGERVKVSWWGRAQDTDVAELLFNSEFGEYIDITRPTWGSLPILRYTSPQSFVTAGTLESAGRLTESISLPRSFIPTGGKLEVTFDASLMGVILESLEAIPAPVPTSSNEALLSYLLPNLVAYQALQASGLNNQALKARLEAEQNEGVQRLINSQNEDFGWGWYADSQSDPYLSAYILFGLWQARETGVYINETVFVNAREYLHAASLPYLETATPETWQKDRLAFIQYVMQMSGGADAIPVDQLYEWRLGLSPWAQALLALTLDSRSAGDARASGLLANLEASALRSASGAHWESDGASWRNPGTPNYNTAIVIYALAQKDATNPLMNDAVRYLSAHRNIHGYWNSTYENAWTLLAFTEVMKKADELNANFSFSADLNGDLLAEAQANVLAPIDATMLIDKFHFAVPNALNISRTEGDGRLYYRAALFVDRAAETAPALNQGIEISRIYYNFDCKENCVALDSAKLSNSTKIKAQLIINLPEDSYYLMVEDYIPAGTEILNQQLKTSQLAEDADEAEFYDPDNPYAKCWGWWFFSAPQIGDENITWSADYLPAGTYVLSYTLIPLQAGEYRVLPAQAWMSYFPEVQGTSAGVVFGIEK